MPRSPASEAGSGRPIHTSNAAAARIPPGTQSGRSALMLSATQAVWAEAHVGELAALRALADVLGKLLRVQRLHRAVLALDAGDGERLAVRHRDICQRNIFRKSNQLHADAAVGPLGHLAQLEEQQPRIR